MPSVTRPTRRSSRISSPHAQSRPPALEQRKEKARTVLQAWPAGSRGSPAATDGSSSRPTSVPSEPGAAEAEAASTWVEPPVVERPSFEDYGLQRQGVLLHMAPLGSLPTAKLKARLRGDVDRRLQVAKDGAGVSSEDGRDTHEMTPALESEVSESSKAANQEVKPSLRKGDEDEEYVPGKAKKAPSRPAKAAAVPSSPGVAGQGTPNSRTAASRPHLETVVKAAVQKAEEAGSPGLGLALRQVYVDSLKDQGLKDLLDAALDQRLTPDQKTDFQVYIKRVKKQIKAGEISLDSLRKRSVSHSVHSGSQEGTPEDTPVTEEPTIRLSIPKNRKLEKPTNRRSKKSKNKHPNENSSLSNGHNMNGKASVENGVRRSRSGSQSSMSSLTSIASLDEKATQEPATSGNLVNGQKTQPSLRSKNNSNANTISVPPVVLKRPSTEAGLSDEEDRALEAKRRKIMQTQSFDDYHVEDSGIRASPANMQQTSLRTGRQSKPSAALFAAQSLHGSNKSKKQNLPGEFEDVASAASDSLLPGSTAQSRSGTPHIPVRPPKKAKTAARIKMSPVKRKTGVIAGIARASGARVSPIGYDDNEEQSDNNDFCSACGGSGFLLCCDGCDRSFHFTCCDPPLDYNASSLDEPWYCYECEAKRNTPQKHPRGLFAALLGLLDKANPSSFVLPGHVRDYFEGVKTSAEGEYEEVALQKSSKNRTGYDELPDLTKLKDAKGNVVLCSHCGGSSLNHQQIIACDYCPSQFHLDCLDPPLANPPPMGSNGKRNTWMCPRHIEHDLRVIDPRQSRMGGGGRVHRVRKPKNAKPKDVFLNRGFKNNGCIEIEFESSDDEFYEDESASGIIYRLPEKGIILDFIDKVKSSRMENRPRPGGQRVAPADRSSDPVPKQNGHTNFVNRPFVEQKAALTLAHLAQREQEVGLSSDRVGVLVQSLIAESPNAVAAAITAAENAPVENHSGHPTPPSSDDSRRAPTETERQELLMLQELIRKRLEGA